MSDRAVDWKYLFEAAEQQRKDWSKLAIDKAFKLEGLEQKIKSFRKKLENITIDELLKNPKIVLELFDDHFK